MVNKSSIFTRNYPKPCYEVLGIGWEQEALAKPIEILIAANLKRLLREKEMRPADLARAVGVDRSAVHAWQNGIPPTVSNLQKIAGAFGVPIRELIEDPLDTETMGIDIETALRVIAGVVKASKSAKE